MRCGTSAYHIALLIDTQRGRIGIEFYVPNDKVIGHKAIGNASEFEKRLCLEAKPFDAKKASGVRFYKDGCKIKGNEKAWEGFIKQQLNWALEMKQVVDEQQPDAALVQHTRQQPQDRYVLADVLATLRAAGVPALTDDNYAVMKVARIGCECGANVSTFSCFKLFGPEGVGAVVGDADVISRIRATLYSGGSQIQGAQALEVLRGLVLAPVMHLSLIHI